jgi:hypothetical protein
MKGMKGVFRSLELKCGSIAKKKKGKDGTHDGHWSMTNKNAEGKNSWGDRTEEERGIANRGKQC